MKRKRKYKIPLKHIVLLEIMYSVLVGIIILFFNGRDFISLPFAGIVIASILIGSFATYIHIRV